MQVFHYSVFNEVLEYFAYTQIQDGNTGMFILYNHIDLDRSEVNLK